MRIIKKEGKDYKNFVGLYAKANKIVKTCGKVAVSIEIYPPDKRKRDIDNVLKVLNDSLVEANVIEDDSNIDVLHIERKAVIKDGKILLTITPLLNEVS